MMMTSTAKSVSAVLSEPAIIGVYEHDLLSASSAGTSSAYARNIRIPVTNPDRGPIPRATYV